MNKVVKNERIKFLDVAKGIAIIAVVLGHTAGVCESSIFNNMYIMGNINKNIIIFTSSFHMPMFFILSGIALFYNNTWQNISIKEFFIKKSKKILYPYVIFSILIILFQSIMFSGVDILKDIIDTVILNGISILWFLIALLIGEVLFVTIIKLCKNKLTKIIIFILFIITNLFLYKINYIPYYDKYINIFKILNVLNRGIAASVFISIGYYSTKILKKMKITKIMQFTLGLLTFILYLYFYKNNGVDFRMSVIGNPIWYSINLSLGTFSFIMFSKTILEKCKFLAFLGKNSLIIYLTHLNFLIINHSINLSLKIFAFKSYIIQFIFLSSIIIAIESLLILIINKYLKILIDYNKFDKLVVSKIKVWLKKYDRKIF
ncbi:MAG: acyltransferase [bacterium]|nr:acyltransferase [bacterium]